MVALGLFNRVKKPKASFALPRIVWLFLFTKMEDKQTALEWLKEKLNDSIEREPSNPTSKELGYTKALKDIIFLIEDEGFKREKQQKKDAYLMAYNVYKLLELGK